VEATSLSMRPVSLNMLMRLALSRPNIKQGERLMAEMVTATILTVGTSARISREFNL
jgi:hypothetical protein